MDEVILKRFEQPDEIREFENSLDAPSRSIVLREPGPPRR
jgi:hypothetical protein